MERSRLCCLGIPARGMFLLLFRSHFAVLPRVGRILSRTDPDGERRTPSRCAAPPAETVPKSNPRNCQTRPPPNFYFSTNLVYFRNFHNDVFFTFWDSFSRVAPSPPPATATAPTSSYSSYSYSTSPKILIHAARRDPYDAAIAGTSGSVQDPKRTL